MGRLGDIINTILGTAAEEDATNPADAEDLFAVTQATIEVEAALGYQLGGVAGICFSDVDSTEFDRAIDEVEGVLLTDDATGEADIGVTDTKGYQWITVRNESDEAIVSNIQYAASTLIQNDFGSRLLAAVFPLVNDGEHAYLIYSFNRGSYYPFAPNGKRSRDSQVEFKLESTLQDVLDVEEDKDYWYPLWPDTVGAHPWE